MSYRDNSDYLHFSQQRSYFGQQAVALTGAGFSRCRAAGRGGYSWSYSRSRGGSRGGHDDPGGHGSSRVKTATRTLIDDMVRTLLQRVLPATSDPAAAAHLQEVTEQLHLLAVRIECQGEIVWSDIADQRLMLAAIEQETRHLPDDLWKGLAEDIARELDRVWHTPAHYPEMVVLEAENHRLRALIDRALEAVQAVPEPLGEKRAQRLLKALNGYLKRQADREAPLRAPLQTADS